MRLSESVPLQPVNTCMLWVLIGTVIYINASFHQLQQCDQIENGLVVMFGVMSSIKYMVKKMHIHVEGIEHPENDTHRSRLVFCWLCID